MVYIGLDGLISLIIQLALLRVATRFGYPICLRPFCYHYIYLRSPRKNTGGGD